MKRRRTGGLASKAQQSAPGVAGVEFKKLSKIKNFYHLFHRFTRDCVGVFAVPLPLCRGRLYACVPNGFVSGLAPPLVIEIAAPRGKDKETDTFNDPFFCVDT